MKVSAQNCEVEVFSNVEDLNEAAATLIVAIAADVLRTQDKFSLVLSGGSTPKALYELLAAESFKDKIDWSRTLIFFGDERCVAPENAESNYRMARESMLSRIAIPGENVFRLRGEIAPERAAEEYEAIIERTLGANPQFDLILLGLGDDGHTASLFPASAALREKNKSVAANYVEKFKSNRLTLTFRVINEAKNILFLVAGEKKAETVKNVLAAETIDLPASLIKPRDGKCRWFLDASAAKLL